MVDFGHFHSTFSMYKCECALSDGGDEKLIKAFRFYFVSLEFFRIEMPKSYERDRMNNGTHV